MKNSKLYKLVLSDGNIFNSIFSLESYVFEKDLLSDEDIIKFNKLSDKHNKEYINNTIDECRELLESVLENNDLFNISVFVKPKKYNKKLGEVEFRPIHTADLITQICIVSLLNPLIFNDIGGERKLSDISRLLPSNFYGNIPSVNVDSLFKPWQNQYGEYSKNVLEALRMYNRSKKYKWEINLDIEKFYPSIDPIFIFNLIYDKLSLIYSKDNEECFKQILKKLLFFNITNVSNCPSSYFSKDILDQININHLYNIGIPQGLPQAYFFGNLCMSIISNEIDSTFEGDSYYYVDDSVIFSNLPKSEEDFFDEIKRVNKSINTKIKKIIEEYQFPFYDDLNLYNFHKVCQQTYNIHIYNTIDGKSTISKITNETPLNILAKPASNTSFEIKSAIDEIDDTFMKGKIESLINYINIKIDKTHHNTHEIKDLKSEGNLKSYQRYKKFYSNRLNALLLRKENEISIEKIEEFYILYGLNDKENNENSIFFEKLNDDVFITKSKIVIRQLQVEPLMQNDVILKIKNFEENIGKDKEISNHYFSKVLYSYSKSNHFNNREYESLEKEVSKIFNSYLYLSPTKSLSAINSVIKVISSENIDDTQFKKGTEEYRIWQLIESFNSGYSKFVFTNSEEFRRKIINALFSKIFCVTLNDSCNLIKIDNRAIHYYELRLLMYVRSRYYFKLSTFLDFTQKRLFEGNIKKDSEKVDLSLFEILQIFKDYVKTPEKIDGLILTHKYVNGIWKNGSKFLHFYTLHNEEHSIELIKYCTKVAKMIDYLSIKNENYFALFLACYLHDVSMVLYPYLDEFTHESLGSDIVYSNWKIDYTKLQNIEFQPKSEIKKNILKYFKAVDEYFEINIRNAHSKNSSSFIKTQSDLDFIERSLRQLVADISESHGYDSRDVYQKKSQSKDDLFDEKYSMIILRLADLFDMSKDRVSTNVLSQNINAMSEKSKFHWISHLATDDCRIETKYDNSKIILEGEEVDIIIETIQIIIKMNTQILSSLKKGKCKNMCCTFDIEEIKSHGKDIRNYIHTMKIDIGKDNCSNSKCNFMCKWVTIKHKYLFDELIALKAYLDRTSNNIFKTEIVVVLELENTSIVPPEYIDIVKNEITN